MSHLEDMIEQIEAQAERAYVAAPSGPQRITTRYTACGCGCKGADSWHKPTIKRCIREFRTVAPEQTSNYLVKVAEGIARMPWGMEPVIGEVVRRDSGLSRHIYWTLAQTR